MIETRLRNWYLIITPTLGVLAFFEGFFFKDPLLRVLLVVSDIGVLIVLFRMYFKNEIKASGLSFRAWAKKPREETTH